MSGIDWQARVRESLPAFRVADAAAAQLVFKELIAGLESERDFVMCVGACAFYTAKRMQQLRPAPADGFFGLTQAEQMPENDPKLNAFRVLVATLNSDADMVISIAVTMFRSSNELAAEFLAHTGANLSLMFSRGHLPTCADPHCPTHGTTEGSVSDV